MVIQAEGYPSDELTRQLIDRTTDLVLQYDPPTNQEVQSKKVGEISLVLASTRRESSSERALTTGYIYVDWGTSFAALHAERHGEKSHPELHVNLVNVALGILEHKKGAPYLPLSTVCTT